MISGGGIEAGLNLTTRDIYFMILVQVFMNHILVENTYFTNHIEWTKHKIMFKYQIFGIAIILKTFLLAISSIIHFFLLSKNFVKNIFHRAEDNISKRKDN